MTRPGPGKFEGCESLEVAERLYGIVMDSSQDATMGDVEEYGVVLDLIGDAICTTDQQGFFTYVLFPSEQAAQERWQGLETKLREEEAAQCRVEEAERDDGA